MDSPLPFSKISQISVRLLLTVSGLAHLNAADHPPIVVYGFFGLLFLSPFIAQNVLTKKSWLLTVNALTLGYLLFGMGQLFIIKVAPLNLGSSFLLVLLINKLLGPNNARDLQQLVLLSLLQMVITTALSSNLNVGILLLAYAVILPWALVNLALQSDAEALSESKQRPLTGLPADARRKLRVLLVLTGFGIIVATSLFFILVPRLGFGLFAANPSQNTMTGFSSRVNLGDFGRIKTNRQAVMRIKVKDPERLQKGRLYWRGISLDHYANGHWSKSFKEQRTLELPRQGSLALTAAQPKGIEQEIFLEPLAEKVLFGISQINGLSTCDSTAPTPKSIQFFQDQVGDLYFETAQPQTLRYCITSKPVKLTEAHQTQDLTTYSQFADTLSAPFKQLYFQIPSDASPILDEIIERMEIETKNVLELSTEIETFLETNYRYTLNRKVVDTQMPIKDFLIDSPEGHCEYFASAMVLLLRRHGIAARLVNGFAGGMLNKFGNYLLVHQGNAHSWVEVFLPEKVCDQPQQCRLTGTWIAFDPTPSQEMTPEPKSWWKDLMDATRLRWAEYIVRYNLRTQMSWMSEVFRWISAPETVKQKETSAADSPAQPSSTKTTGSYRLLFGFCVSFLLLGILVRFRRYFKTKTSQNTQVTDESSRLYKRFVIYYQNHGVEYAEHMTAEEFLQNIMQSEHPTRSEAESFIRTYLRIRFSPSTEELHSLQSVLDLIEAAEPSRQ